MSALRKPGRFKVAVLVLASVLAVLAALVWFLNTRGEVDVINASMPAAPADQTLVERGAYLARAGNCAGCHTARGGEAYAGGLGIGTPFGTVFTSNLTPDKATGIGDWTPAHFWRAMHNGRSKDGRLLYPAFPYTSYTKVTREDSDAIYAFLQSQPAVVQPNREHGVGFPYNSQAALAVWRALYFRPGTFQPTDSRNAEWNRGAYLVQGLGHCAACHSARNALGATTTGLGLAGGLIPMQNWYAPSLASPDEAGVGHWSRAEVVSLLKTGVSPRASVTGPMAEVVLRSTQYLNDADLDAMAQYLQALPGMRSETDEPDNASVAARVPTTTLPPKSGTQPPGAGEGSVGGKLYAQHCAQCHGDNGQGVPNAYPALAGNRAVTMANSANLVQIVLNGGYAPATAGNPRPFGMPPFVLVLNDQEVATLLTYVRQSWGNRAEAVTQFEVHHVKTGSSSQR
ncbi:MAG: cytochrome c [Comamonadaceae bacterium]|nr:MAG: cytochrome c [Comamonadaceae bacterium]